MSEHSSDEGRRDTPVRLEPVLARQRDASRERRSPEATALLDGAIERLTESGIARSALGPGDAAPSFALGNVRGELIRLGDLLGRGALVLAFYRGGW